MVSNSEKNNLNIYPNPTTGRVTVDLPHNKIERIFLYDNLGKCVKELIIPPDTIKVEFNLEDDLPYAGVEISFSSLRQEKVFFEGWERMVVFHSIDESVCSNSH